MLAEEQVTHDFARDDAGPKPELLFLTEVFPFPLDRGQHVRVWNLLLACSRAFDVTFIGPAYDVPGGREAIENVCKEAIYVNEGADGWPARLLELAASARLSPGLRTPATIQRYAPFVAALRKVDPSKFALIWAERPQMACLCRDFLERTVLDFDDIEHLKTAGRFSVERGAWRILHNAYRYVFYRQLELSMARRCLGSVVCSDDDAAYLSRHGCRNPIIVPNAASSTLLEPDPARRSRSVGTPLRLLFLGHLGSQPNADAIAFLGADVMPLLRERFPGVILDVIGGGEIPASVSQLPSDVRFLGFVAELSPAMQGYDMMVAPLRFGGGTKLKVLDAMARGLPVVTTPTGAQGLPVVHGEHVLIAETAPAIVEAIGRLKHDHPLAERIGANAYALVRDRFSWGAIQRDLAASLPTLLAARRR